jgi:hypothetical protein
MAELVATLFTSTNLAEVSLLPGCHWHVCSGGLAGGFIGINA